MMFYGWLKGEAGGPEAGNDLRAVAQADSCEAVAGRP